MSSTDKKVLFLMVLVSLAAALLVGGVVFGLVFGGLISLVIGIMVGFGSLCGVGKLCQIASLKEFWQGILEGFKERAENDNKIFSKVIEIVEVVIGLFPEEPPAPQETETPAAKPEDDEDEFW